MLTLVRTVRRRRRPSLRNLAIYKAVKIEGQRQEDAAARFGVCQARVSQIVASVDVWRCMVTSDELCNLTPEQFAMVERLLATLVKP